ncbi:MAG: 2-oxoisovalerate dehydrogenase [Oscillospiraceae bacterium]|nr:2-oxoisovalerate dehydrogenase [Oscillospiraceae bacterium]
MVNEIIFTVNESFDGGYEAKAVGHSIFTQCDEYDELPMVLRDAVKCHFDEDKMPSLIRIHLVKDMVIAV